MKRSTKAHTLTSRIGLFVVATLLGALPIAAAPPPVAHAATINVNTTDDELNSDGDCSLREAIQAANTNAAADNCTAGQAAPDLDTITFAASTNAESINLTGAAGEDANASGDLDLLDGGDLTIQGNGAANTIIDGNDTDRVFHVCPGGGCANTVIFSGVTIRNGSNVVHGGGIFNAGGTTTVDGSSVSANTATYGSGISNVATLYVQNGSTIGGAGAGMGNGAALSGGGIYNHTGTTTVEGSTVSVNTAAKDGGGIYNWSGTTTVDGSTVISNTAPHGGGIYNRGTLKVQNGSAIGGAGAGTGNEATEDGGGIYNYAGTTTVDASTVSANTATVDGGGIYNRATLTVTNGSTIGGAGAGAGNTATVDGGGIYNGTDGTATVDGSTVSANTAVKGGGIYNSGGTTTVDGSTVSANTAYYGGGIYNEATLNVRNGSTIGGAGAGNQATTWGGGIYNLDGTTTVDGSTVSANTAANGGGIHNRATLTVTNGSTIGGAGMGNEATIWGGGIYHDFDATTTTVMGSRILNNGATINGGGLCNHENSSGATNVTGSCIVGNSATSFLNNNQAVKQTATANWWGAVGGPDAPGADTVGGNVDTSGFLNTPILGCAPDLQVDKANDTGGSGTLGTPFNWALTVANTGVVDAVFNAGQRILDDDLPAGPTYGAPVVGSLVNVTNGANISCSIASDTLTCNATGANVTIGAATGTFAVVFSVTPHASGALSNPAGNCRVDPDGIVTESDESNNNCPADTVNVGEGRVYLPLVLRQSP